MRNRVGRGLLALSTVLALLLVNTAPAAVAETKQVGDRVCSMYANSNGFGAYCSAGTGNSNEILQTWRQRTGGRVFIPCRDFEVPPGITLPAAPDGKTWVLRLTIVKYDLNSTYGGNDVHLERAIVPVSQDERNQCPKLDYMNPFWDEFHEGYPDPVLVVKPTFTPRVNVPAYFSLTPQSSLVFKHQDGNPHDTNDSDTNYYGPGQFLTMRAVVSDLIVDPGDGTKPFKCLMGVDNFGGDGYDGKQDPFHQTSMCKHVYKRSSANQPDGMFRVRLTIVWDVSYWKTKDDWVSIGKPQIEAVQRLPVQEVQTIGG